MNSSNSASPAGSNPDSDSEVATAIPAAAEARRVGRLGLITLVIGFGGFLLWAGLAPLDEGVPGHGVVAIDTKRKPVQHLTGGIVKEVLVGEGTVVHEGQLLVRLDEAVAQRPARRTIVPRIWLKRMMSSLRE